VALEDPVRKTVAQSADQLLDLLYGETGGMLVEKATESGLAMILRFQISAIQNLPHVVNQFPQGSTALLGFRYPVSLLVHGSNPSGGDTMVRS
jgi:hypothetical protein